MTQSKERPDSSKKLVTVEVRSAYGRSLNYPVDANATTFAKMLNRSTLTESDLDAIRSLGFDVLKQQADKGPGSKGQNQWTNRKKRESDLGNRIVNVKPIVEPGDLV